MATFNRQRVMTLLRQFGYRHALVSFSGGNDSGDVDFVRVTRIAHQGDPDVTDAKDETIDLDTTLPYGTWDPHTNKMVYPKLTPEQELIAQLTQPVWDEWGSFAGEFYVSGTVEYDVEEDTIRIEQSVETPQSDYQTRTL